MTEPTPESIVHTVLSVVDDVPHQYGRHLLAAALAGSEQQRVLESTLADTTIHG